MASGCSWVLGCNLWCDGVRVLLGPRVLLGQLSKAEMRIDGAGVISPGAELESLAALRGDFCRLRFDNPGCQRPRPLVAESANQDLQNRLLNLESANLMQELQSINNKCIAKIGFVDNKYEYLMDRTLTLQSEVVTTQTLCKEERLSLTDKIRSLEPCVSEEHNRWYDSMKNLESQAREEVHSLEQTLCARLQALEETLCKHDIEPNKQKGKTIKVVTSPNGSNPTAYPVIIHERPADDTHPEPYVTHTLQPISIRDFKNMKEAIVTYGIHSTYVKQMLNSWSTSNRIIPDDWHQLTSAVLEYSQQLQWKCWLREEARNLEELGSALRPKVQEDVLKEGMLCPETPAGAPKITAVAKCGRVHNGYPLSHGNLNAEFKHQLMKSVQQLTRKYGRIFKLLEEVLEPLEVQIHFDKFAIKEAARYKSITRFNSLRRMLKNYCLRGFSSTMTHHLICNTVITVVSKMQHSRMQQKDAEA
ncbi:hypothetical protein STEG23_031128 [Scotinomys teguina]